MKSTRATIALPALLLIWVLAACDSGAPTPTSAVRATPTITAATSATSQPTRTTTEDAIVAAAGRLIILMAEGDFEGVVADFDETMAAQLPADKLRETWQLITSQYGAFKEQLRSEVARQDAYVIAVVECEFERGHVRVRVVFNADRKVAGLFFAPATNSTPEVTEYAPPAYVRLDSFTEQELNFGSAEWVLTGTLTLPKTAGPHPAVVLAHGSGPNDRDETIGPNRPFRDLAWGLASNGVAVFRYDKRTLVYGAKMAAMADRITVEEEVVEDAVQALALVAGTEGIDSSRVFLVGHSLGGMLAPMIAERAPTERGFVTMAAPTRPLEDLVLEQFTYIAGLDGMVTPEEQAELDKIAEQAANVKKLEVGTSVPPDQLPLGLPAAYWLSLRGYGPAEMAKGLDEPAMILQGERDYQVTMEDFAGWQSALAGREDATLKSYPSLNHLFIEGEGPSTPAEYEKPGHVAETVIREIAEWIADH